MLSYIANPISKQHSIYNLSIVLGRGEEREEKEKEEEKNCSRKKRRRPEVIAREILINRMKTANYKLKLLVRIELFPPTNKIIQNFANRNS